MTQVLVGDKVMTMNDTQEMHPISGSEIDAENTQSIFHDRHEGPFVRWMEGQGLSHDASDELILQAMTKHCEARNSASINP